MGPLPDLTAGSASRPDDSTRIRFRLRTRSAARRIGRRLLLAEYWRAHGDLDEANRHADRALRLLARGSTVPGQLAATTAVTAAEIARDRAQRATAHDRHVWAVDLLETLPATDARERLLARALLGLGDSHRRGLGRGPRVPCGRVNTRGRRPAPKVLGEFWREPFAFWRVLG